MNLSARTQYACKAVLELALHFDSGHPVQLRKIADSHAIPSRFLVQILQQLKAAGLVASVRGAAGGYRLTKPPSETSLGEVITLVEGANSALSAGATATSPVARVLQEKWQEIASTEARMLESTTFAELAEQVQDVADPMYYI